MSQITVLTGPERRRRWRPEDKLRILAEAFSPGDCVGAVARRHDVSRGLIYTWRRKLRRELRSEEHTSELQSLMRISYAVFCLKKKTQKQTILKISPYTTNAKDP